MRPFQKGACNFGTRRPGTRSDAGGVDEAGGTFLVSRGFGRGVSPPQGAGSGERNGSERAQIASVAKGIPPASQATRTAAR